MSSATFLLDPGVNTININYEGKEGDGHMDFIAEGSPVPEPSSLVLLGSGLMGMLLLFSMRRKRMA